MEASLEEEGLLCEASKCSLLMCRALLALGWQFRMVIHTGMAISNTPLSSLSCVSKSCHICQTIYPKYSIVYLCTFWLPHMNLPSLPGKTTEMIYANTALWVFLERSSLSFIIDQEVCTHMLIHAYRSFSHVLS